MDVIASADASMIAHQCWLGGTSMPAMGIATARATVTTMLWKKAISIGRAASDWVRVVNEPPITVLDQYVSLCRGVYDAFSIHDPTRHDALKKKFEEWLDSLNVVCWDCEGDEWVLIPNEVATSRVSRVKAKRAAGHLKG